MTLGIMTIGIMTFGIMTLGIKTLGIMTLRKLALCTMTPRMKTIIMLTLSISAHRKPVHSIKKLRHLTVNLITKFRLSE
jgi:hypothetical protein